MKDKKQYIHFLDREKSGGQSLKMSTTAAPLALTLAPQQMSIYIGVFFLITGVTGGILVLVVFLSLKTFRQSSCAFYLTIKSIGNISYLMVGLFPFIVSYGFGINWTIMSIPYCKFRVFYVQLGSLVSVTCTCLAAIDQFLATCSNPRWHRWATIKVAHNTMIIVAIILILYSSPTLILYTHIQSPTTGRISCTTTNAAYIWFNFQIHVPVVVSSLPAAIMTLFGLLAYRNVRNIAYRTVPLVRRELDKQLTSIVLVQVVYDVIFVLMVIVQTIFNAAIGTPTDAYNIALINFIRIGMTLLYYFDFVVCFDRTFSHVFLFISRAHSTSTSVYPNDFVNNSCMSFSPLIPTELNLKSN